MTWIVICPKFLPGKCCRVALLYGRTEAQNEYETFQSVSSMGGDRAVGWLSLSRIGTTYCILIGTG